MPEIQRQTRKALRAGKCVVIGLQSTGDLAVKEAFARALAKSPGASSKVVSTLVSAAREAVEGLLETLGKQCARTRPHAQARVCMGMHVCAWECMCMYVACSLRGRGRMDMHSHP